MAPLGMSRTQDFVFLLAERATPAPAALPVSLLVRGRSDSSGMSAPGTESITRSSDISSHGVAPVQVVNCLGCLL